MEKNKFHIEDKGSYILIEAEGVRQSLKSAYDGTLVVHDTAVLYNKKYVLADFRKIRYEVDHSQAFNLVRIYESNFPELSKITIAGVIDQQYWEIAKLWKSICKKRNFNYHVFSILSDARTWLLSEIRAKNGDTLPLI